MAAAAEFEKSKYRLHCHHDVGSAHAGLTTTRFHFAIANIRLSMPDGKPLLSYIAAVLPRVRRIALVDQPDIASVQLAMKWGCKSYLARPVSPTSLLNVVDDVARSTGLLSISDRELQVRLSQLLRAERVRQRLTLADMADRVGVCKAQLSQIELAKRWPSLPTLKRILDELDQPFSDFFKGIEHATL